MKPIAISVGLILSAVAGCAMMSGLVAVATYAAPAEASDIAIGNPQDGGGCWVAGDDAGTLATIPVPPNSQFMITASSTVTYKSCALNGVWGNTNPFDGGPACAARAQDATIAAGAQVDLCQRSGFNAISVRVPSGTSTVCAFSVSPKTVCQVNAP